MSKFKMGLLALGLMLSAFGGVGLNGEAQAACGTFWEMGEKSVSFCGGATEDGAFTAKLEGNEKDAYVSTVILNDYKGEAFYPRTYGSGHYVRKFVVELNGVNEVTLPKAGDEGSEQVYMGGVEYELRGEGRLIVKAVSGSEGPADDSGDFGGASAGDRMECDDFEAEDAATWVLVRVGIVAGIAVIVALVTFGTVKLVQEVKKGKR